MFDPAAVQNDNTAEETYWGVERDHFWHIFELKDAHGVADHEGYMIPVFDDGREDGDF